MFGLLTRWFRAAFLAFANMPGQAGVLDFPVILNFDRR